MNRQTLADVLQDTNQTGSYTLATVLEGAETEKTGAGTAAERGWQSDSSSVEITE